MRLEWDRRPSREGVSVVTTLDAHAAGEPLRIITGGLPEVPGVTMLERRRYLQEHLDHVRRALMWEPRGHFNMYGCVLTPPVSPDADLGVLFMHNEGYSTMCGHGVIALVTALLETGALPAKGRETSVTLDTPAGLIRATGFCNAAGDVERVSFLNVPAFVCARDITLDLSQSGLSIRAERDAPLLVDVAFGGAYYAIAPAAYFGLDITPARAVALVAAGETVTAAVNATVTIQHPTEPDLSFLYGTILTGPPAGASHHSRNICVFANEEVDRSPTGTGVSARLALLHARGEVADDQWIAIESILGAQSVFTGRVAGHAQVGPYAAIVPEVSGTATITGRHEFLLDPRDELGSGFLIA